MHKIKKYANGRLYDTTDKKYITLKQLSEMIKEGEKTSIVLTKTGEDITSSIISKLSAKRKPTKEASGNADTIKKWLGDNIDKRVRKVLGIMNLATKKEVTDLTTTIESLTKKVEKLESLQVKKAVKLDAQKAEKQKELHQTAKEVHQTAVASMAK
jgi:polyhydroxyalkanoate synthesis regulator protein